MKKIAESATKRTALPPIILPQPESLDLDTEGVLEGFSGAFVGASVAGATVGVAGASVSGTSVAGSSVTGG